MLRRSCFGGSAQFTLGERRWGMYISGDTTEAPMSKVEQLEREVRQLSEQELATFRAWFSDYDAARWDEQFEADAQRGRLDTAAEAALADHAAGRSRPL